MVKIQTLVEYYFIFWRMMLLEENHKFILKYKTNCDPICLFLLLLYLPEETGPKKHIAKINVKEHTAHAFS